MIVLVLFLTVLEATAAPAQQDYPHYYAFRTRSDRGYKVFTRRMDCTDPVYETGDDQVLLKAANKWVIGSLEEGSRDDDEDLECQNIASFVDHEYESTEMTPSSGNHWINIGESTKTIKMKAYIGIKSFNKCEEITGLRTAGQGIVFSKENCGSEDYWATKYPGRTIFVSITDSHCTWAFTKYVRLYDDISAKLFVHSSCGRDENGGAVEQQNNNEIKVQEKNNNPTTNGNLFS